MPCFGGCTVCSMYGWARLITQAQKGMVSPPTPQYQFGRMGAFICAAQTYDDVEHVCVCICVWLHLPTTVAVFSLNRMTRSSSSFPPHGLPLKLLLASYLPSPSPPLLSLGPLAPNTTPNIVVDNPPSFLPPSVHTFYSPSFSSTHKRILWIPSLTHFPQEDLYSNERRRRRRTSSIAFRRLDNIFCTAANTIANRGGGPKEGLFHLFLLFAK